MAAVWKRPKELTNSDFIFVMTVSSYHVLMPVFQRWFVYKDHDRTVCVLAPALAHSSVGKINASISLRGGMWTENFRLDVFLNTKMLHSQGPISRISLDPFMAVLCSKCDCITVTFSSSSEISLAICKDAAAAISRQFFCRVILAASTGHRSANYKE